MLRIAFFTAFVCCLMAYAESGYAQIVWDEVPEEVAKKGRMGTEGLNNKHFYILLGGGSAIPLGNYGSQSFFNINSGFARAGGNAQVNLGKLFTRHFGITASVGMIKNPINKDAISEILSYSATLSAGTPLYVNNLQYKGYYHWYTTAGALGTIQLRDNAAVDIRLQAGVSLGVDSKTEVTITNNTQSFTLRIDQARAPAIMFNPGINLRMVATKRLLLAINIDYFYASYTFKDVNISAGGATGQAADYDLTMNNFVTGFSLGIFLD